jgi:hypothetical protein
MQRSIHVAEMLELKGQKDLADLLVLSLTQAVAELSKGKIFSCRHLLSIKFGGCLRFKAQT